MARFRYTLQSVLDIKKKMETQRKQEFSMAKNRLDEEEKRMDALLHKKSEYEEKAKSLRMGTLHMLDIRENREAIRQMDELIAQQKKNVQAAAENLDDARGKLVQVTKERKTYESLREKAFEEFLLEENRQESKTVDELTSYTYGQKRQVKN